MTPDAIVTSLEWSKKLKEAGWPQEGSFFYRVCYSDGTFYKLWDEAQRKKKWIGSWQKKYPCFAAPSAEEILRRLPVFIRSKNLEYALEMMKFFDGSYGLWYTKTAANRNKRSGSCHTDTSLANAAAAIWIYLKENSLLPDSN